MVGELPDARARRPPRASRARATRSRSSARSRRRSRQASWRSCGAGSCPTGCPRSTSTRWPRRRRLSARRCAPARSQAPTTSPRAASRSRWRSAAWAASLGAHVRSRRSLFGAEGAGATGREAGLERNLGRDSAATLFGEGSGGFVVSGDEAGAARRSRIDRRASRSGAWAGDALQIDWVARLSRGHTHRRAANRAVAGGAGRGAWRARGAVRLSVCIQK